MSYQKHKEMNISESYNSEIRYIDFIEYFVTFETFQIIQSLTNNKFFISIDEEIGLEGL